jgi:CheY-specific phosphatase CheX
MELYHIHTKILTPFMKETVSALKSMASMDGKLGTASVEEVSNFSFKGFAVAVVAKTYGSIEGKILMHYTDDMALKVGKKILAAMLGAEPDIKEIDEDTSEAVTEFSNTIIGLATNALSQSDLKIKFTPPIFVHSQKDMELLMEGVQQILTVPIEVPNIGDFSFSYLLHKRVE